VHLRNRTHTTPQLCDKAQACGKNGSGAGTKRSVALSGEEGLITRRFQIQEQTRESISILEGGNATFYADWLASQTTHFRKRTRKFSKQLPIDI
jgi:hypothetical protein